MKNLRLVSADAVKEIISKYEKRWPQSTMIFEIERLSGCLANQEQEVDILGNGDIKFQD